MRPLGGVPPQRAAPGPGRDRLLPADGMVLRREVKGPDALEGAALGWYQALIEARIPFEMVHDRLLDAGHLAAFRTLILPNIAALSDPVRANPAVCGEAAAAWSRPPRPRSADEAGNPRKDFGLGDLFGAKWKGTVEGPMRNAYVTLEHGAGPGTPAFPGPLGCAPDHKRGVAPRRRPTSGPQPLLTLIPSYPDLPMEKVYPRTPHTDIPQVFLREVPSGGRVVVFSLGHRPDLLGGALPRPRKAPAKRRRVGDQRGVRPLTVEGPGVLDVTYWKQRNSLTVHLVNLTNPMMMKGPVRELDAVGPHAGARAPSRGAEGKEAPALVREWPRLQPGRRPP